MIWLVCVLLSLICGLLNPYIGLFTIFIGVQCLIMFCFAVIGRSQLRIAAVSLANGDTASGEMLRKTGKASLIASCIVGAVLCVLSSVIGVIVWKLGSGQFDGIVSDVPFDLIGVRENSNACALLATLMVMFNVLGVVIAFVQRGQACRSSMETLLPHQVGISDVSGLKPGPVTILGVLLSGVLGFLNPYFTWLTFLHAIYLLVLFIFAVVLASYRRLAKQQGRAGYMARHLLLQMCVGGSYNRIVQVGIWLIAVILAAVSVLTTGMQVRFWDGFALELGGWSWLPMAVAEVATAVSFTADVRKIRAQ